MSSTQSKIFLCLLLSFLSLPAAFDAVAQEEKRGFFRFNSSKKKAAPKKESPQLGVASGAAQIPPELKKLALSTFLFVLLFALGLLI